MELKTGDRVARDVTPWNIGGVRAPIGAVVERHQSGLMVVETREVGLSRHFVQHLPSKDGYYHSTLGYRFLVLPDDYRDGDLVVGAETERALL